MLLSLTGSDHSTFLKFQADCGEAGKQLATYKSNLRALLNEPSQASASGDELTESRSRAETLLSGLTDLHGNIENLANRAQQLEPFQQRKIRLVDPYNKCRCLVKLLLQRSQTSIEENEVCLVDDNSQKFKWKIKKIQSEQSPVLLPSVCFSLLGFDNDSIDLAKQYVFVDAADHGPYFQSMFSSLKAAHELLQSDQAGANLLAQLPEGRHSQVPLRDHAVRLQGGKR